jgi:hypothetical protein
MVYSKQTEVTKNCTLSDDKDYWLIGSEGKIMRPGNWAERMATTFMSMEAFTSRQKIVMECVSPVMHNNRLCLRVRKKFQQECLDGWQYLEGFAHSNQLIIMDTITLLRRRLANEIPSMKKAPSN